MESFVPSSSPLTAEELTAYIGPGADRYRARFDRFTRAGAPRFEFSWNWPASLAGLWWYLYRKMYGWALLDFVLSVLLGWTLFVPILWGVARAVTGDYLYFLQADRRIREARPIASAAGAPPADALHLARLAAEGGVNAWVPWVAVGATFLVLALAALFFGMAWNAIPPLRDLWPAPPGRWT
ncbi:MAG TPA: hypothetical protein VIU83_03830 [Candidatus Deferrimicrobium sp.]